MMLEKKRFQRRAIRARCRKIVNMWEDFFAEEFSFVPNTSNEFTKHFGSYLETAHTPESI